MTEGGGGREVPGDSNRLWHLHAGLQGLPVNRCDTFYTKSDPDQDERGAELAVHEGNLAECVFVDVAAVTRDVDAEASRLIVICESPSFC